MKQGEIKTIVWDTHEPQKDYIWVHDGKSYEFISGEWKETDINWSEFRFGTTRTRTIICDDNSTPPDNCIWIKDDKVYINTGDNNWEDVTPGPPVEVYTFAGLQISNGPLKYNGENYEIASSWEITSYDSQYGKYTNSTFFNFVEMGQLFEKADFSNYDGNIDNLLDPLDGWRLPTKTEWENILSTTRDGSTVNGSASKHFAIVQLSDSSPANMNGILLFPDGKTIIGQELDYMDDDYYAGGTVFLTSITSEQLSVYLNQGCAFIPCSGYYINWDGWYDQSIACTLLSSTENREYDEYTCYIVNFYSEDSPISYDTSEGKESAWMAVRLVKPIE